MVTGWQIIEKNGENNLYYFDEDGYMVTGLQTIDTESGTCQYYFEADGHMIKDICVTIDEKEFCFDKTGCYTK